jgi:predicted ATPase
MLRALAVENYRSLRRLRLPLSELTVVTGANGTGKSSLYRAFRLLADASRNGVAAALAREGGVSSALWAGPASRVSAVSLRLGFGGDDFGYCIDLGLPMPSQTMFDRDPEIKVESVWAGPLLRPAALLAERRGPLVRIRSDSDGWQQLTDRVQPFDSMLSQVADLDRAPELMHIRELVRSWRFYDHFRTDAEAPLRNAQVGTRTPVLSNDGEDLAAALQTIIEIGDARALAAAVDHGFPGSRLSVDSTNGRFELALDQPGLRRPLSSAELSDGTIRFLLLAAALLSPRPPTLLVLNEPETSLHPELISALAALMAARSSMGTQLIVVTHSSALVTALANITDKDRLSNVELMKDHGQTLIAGQGPLDEPPWHFPDR